MALHKPDSEAVKGHSENLKKTKSERDNGELRRCLDDIRQATERRENLMKELLKEDQTVPWELDDLIRLIPRTLLPGYVNPAPKAI